MTTSQLLRIFHLQKILQEPPTTSWACGPTVAFRMESNNPTQCQARTYLLDIIIVQPIKPQLVRRVVFLILYQNNNPSPNQPKPSPWRETNPIWGISMLDWSVDANGDYRQSPEARVLGNQPNRCISWGPSSSGRLDDLNSI